jgi:hypothetical protein
VSWFPNDLVTDADLLAYERAIKTQFAVTDWEDKRRKALEDWLRPVLQTQGFDLERLRTRFEPDAVYPYTAASFGDETGDAASVAADDLNLAATFATPGTDALFVGSRAQFRGLSVRMLEAVSAVASVLTVSYWSDAWTPLVITDGTQKTTGVSFSGGGAITWKSPSDWVKRPINGSTPRYFVRLTVSATPTGATVGQVGVIRRSALCAAVTHRTLMLIMKEAPSGGPGPWMDKAQWHETEADAALQRALVIVGGEFETDDPPTDQISQTESEQTTSEVSRMPFKRERA